MPDVDPNANLRAKRAAKEAVISRGGAGLSFEDLAKRYGITLERLALMVKREQLRTDLNDRERECLMSYATGKRIKDTAVDVGLSPKTVDEYLHRCGKKLGLRTRTKALHYCILAGWIEVGQGLSDAARASAERAKKERTES